jgi:hypothetical protein
MMSTFGNFLNTLRTREASAKGRLDELRAELEGIQKLVRALEDLESTTPPEVLNLIAQNVAANIALTKTTTLNPNAASPEVIASAARAALLDAMRPMKRGELVRELEARGIILTGRDKNKNLGTILWRKPKMFVHLDKLGYWLTDRELPQIYKPALAEDREP